MRTAFWFIAEWMGLVALAVRILPDGLNVVSEQQSGCRAWTRKRFITGKLVT
jgi:hypothetical protein